MADFDPFSNTDEIRDSDPVNDFLSREEKQFDELKELEQLSSTNSLTTTEPASTLGETNADFFGQPVAKNLSTNEMLETVNKDLCGMGDEISHFDRYDSLKEDGPPRIETDTIRKWQEEQRQRLITKDAASEKRQKEWIKVALEELNEYQRHREDLLTKAKKNNKQAEDAFIRERDEKKPGAEWERVCRFCDFNPKASVRTTKDVSRLRSLLLQLKQTPNASFVAA